MSEQNAIERKPFHESIITMINSASSKEQLEILGELIVRTKIPANHANIATVFMNQCRRLTGGRFVSEQVVGDLMKQKVELRAAEVDAALAKLVPDKLCVESRMITLEGEIMIKGPESAQSAH